jgi:hypothetical protein
MAFPEHLSVATITTLPDTAFYIPNFITPDEEIQLLEKARLQVTSVFCFLSSLTSLDCLSTKATMDCLVSSTPANLPQPVEQE